MPEEPCRLKRRTAGHIFGDRYSESSLSKPWADWNRSTVSGLLIFSHFKIWKRQSWSEIVGQAIP